MSYPGLLHPESLSLWQATADLYLLRRHSNTVLAQSLWGLWVWCSQGLFGPSECLWWAWGLILFFGGRVDSKCDFFPPTTLLGLLLCPLVWGIFIGGIQLSPVHSCSAVSCNFGVLAGEDEHTSFTLPSSSIFLLPETFWLTLIF